MTAVNYIYKHPEDANWADVRTFLRVTKVPLEANSNSDYTASCLWVLYQCCGSTGHKKLISRQKFIQELLKHMLFGETAATQIIAFRIVSVIIKDCHSP